MSDHILNQILQELKEVKQGQQHMREQLRETNEIVRALRDGQEELKAEMEGITLNAHKLHGEVTAIRENLTERLETVETDVQILLNESLSHKRAITRLQNRN